MKLKINNKNFFIFLLTLSDGLVTCFQQGKFAEDPVILFE